MRDRLKQLRRLVIIAAAISLMGCATTQALTTSQWGISKGFQRVNLKGKGYFCRVDPTSPPSDKSYVNCLTMGQLFDYRTAIEVTPYIISAGFVGDGSAPER
jgi:hypothetical protein